MTLKSKPLSFTSLDRYTSRSWPESRQNAWQILTRARAIENQAYLIGCNRVGNDSYNHYRGCSAIISPIGKTLAHCKANVPDTASFLLDLESLEHKRTKFKVLEERDKYIFK